MKKLIMLILLLASFCVAQKPIENQRFQIVEVPPIPKTISVTEDYKVLDNGLISGKASFILIDTQTGDTWTLHVENVESDIQDFVIQKYYWLPIKLKKDFVTDWQDDPIVDTKKKK